MKLTAYLTVRIYLLSSGGLLSIARPYNNTIILYLLVRAAPGAEQVRVSLSHVRNVFDNAELAIVSAILCMPVVIILPPE